MWRRLWPEVGEAEGGTQVETVEIAERKGQGGGALKREETSQVVGKSGRKRDSEGCLWRRGECE